MTNMAWRISPLSLSLLLALAGCGPQADGREGFGSGGDDEAGDGAPDEGEGSISESCQDGIVQPGEVCQVQAETIPAGIDPCALEVGDFDADGRPDLAVPNSDWLQPPEGTHYSHVLRGLGTGDFADAQPWNSGAALPVGIALGDFDGDGDLDVASANYESNSAFVLTNEGGMAFAAPIAAPVPGAASSLAAGDLDEDGRDDLVVTVPGSLALLTSDAGMPAGAGALSLAGKTPMHVELADLDTDGHLDIATTVQDTFGAGQVIIFHGAGDGTFPEFVGHAVGMSPWWVESGDLDGDGDLDLAVADNGDSTISLLLGNDQGGFTARTILPVCIGPQSLAIADMNLDGKQDLVVGCMNSDRVEMWLQVGEDGEFELRRAWSTGATPVSVQAADLDLDGAMDIAWANQLSNSIGLVLAQP